MAQARREFHRRLVDAPRGRRTGTHIGVGLTCAEAQCYLMDMVLKGVGGTPDFRPIPPDPQPAAGAVGSEAPTTPSEPKGWFSSNVGAAGPAAGAVATAADLALMASQFLRG